MTKILRIKDSQYAAPKGKFILGLLQRVLREHHGRGDGKDVITRGCAERL